MPTCELRHQEQQIIQLCVEGLTNGGIASRLGLSVGTANTEWLRIELKGVGRREPRGDAPEE